MESHELAVDLDQGASRARLRLADSVAGIAKYRRVRDYADVLRDTAWERTALGPVVLDWLAWLELAGRSDATLYSYEWRLSKTCLFFPRKPIEEWTDKECSAVVGSFPKGSRHVASRQLNSFFVWAVKQDRILKNPMDKLPDIKAQGRKHIDVFTEAEIEDIYTLPIVDSALMGILFETGLRKAEARKLQVRRLVLSEGEARSAGTSAVRETPIPLGSSWAAAPAPSESTGELVVIGGKGGKDRTVQFGARLHGMLRELLFLEPLNPQDYLWYMRPGGGQIRRSKMLVDASFDRWWRSCLKEAGVRYRTPHVARHTFATRWLRRGGRLETLSLLMGHASIAITADYYGHLGREDVLRDLAVIEG